MGGRGCVDVGGAAGYGLGVCVWGGGGAEVPAGYGLGV